jgi:hypothetical protein
VSDQVLASCSDRLCQGNSTISNFGHESLEFLVRKFRENKISLEKILPLLTVINETNKENFVREAQRDKMFREKWLQTLMFIIDLFNSRGIQYILIKILDYPYALMSDLDILILNPSEELKALEQLSNTGFKTFEFRLLAHPLKLMSLKMDDNDPRISVDFYPAPAWIRKKVCDTEVIFSRARITDINSKKAVVPSSEDSFYLVATHAYNHLAFSLAEILHGLNVINEKFDWEYVFNLSQSYGTSDSVYLYLRLLDIYTKKFRRCSFIPKDIFKPYEDLTICRKINSWFERSLRILEFPVQVPTRIGCIYSSIYHCKIIRAHMTISDLLYDFLTHYLVLFSKAALNKT